MARHRLNGHRPHFQVNVVVIVCPTPTPTFLVQDWQRALLDLEKLGMIRVIQIFERIAHVCLRVDHAELLRHKE